ncbi:MAG: hypothetical protein GF365_05070 [Candidatus Buchananbacteria bacterium]|nr:hypothetical protein [Candidatus Buchananbacteria bacterium]
MDISKDFKLIKHLAWDDVFEIMRQNEDYPGSHWISLWQKRGFNSWQEWRMTYVKRFKLDRLDWQLYEIIEPIKTVPQLCGGSFTSWVKRFYQGEDNPSFAKLAEHPEIQAHHGIIQFMDNFPKNTIISGVILGDKIIIVEGMHRCAALALASLQGQKIQTKMQICLAQHYLDKLPIAGQNTD